MEEQIGTCRQIVMAGEELHFSEQPIYGHRTIGLILSRHDFFQVLIDYHGHFVWINVNRSDVTLFQGITCLNSST